MKSSKFIKDSTITIVKLSNENQSVNKFNINKKIDK